MAALNLLRSVARVAIATVFTGPLGGAHQGAAEAVDIAAGWLAAGDRSPYAAALGRIEKGLKQFAASERISPANLDVALAHARDLFLRHALTPTELAELGMDPERATAAILARDPRPGLDPAERDLARHVVKTALAGLLADPKAMPELDRAFQRAVLSNLRDLDRLPAAVADQLARAAASATLVDPRRPWRPGLFASSTLLRPEFEVVRFSGRRAELEALREWSAGESSLGVRLYTGPGGMGKTRLMIEACRRLRGDGWRAGFLHHAACHGDARGVRHLFELGGRALVVIDYAETRFSDVSTILEIALEPRWSGRLRIVMLARAKADWWDFMLRKRRGVGDLLQGPATDAIRLGPLSAEPSGRQAVFDEAITDFASALGVPRREPIVAPALEAAHFARVLFVHLAALSALEGSQLADEGALLEFALRREQGLWDDGMVAADLPGLAGAPIAQAAALTTLAGRLESRAEAVALLARAPLLGGQSAAAVARVAAVLHGLYPGEARLEGVQPDVLGEHAVARAAETDPALLTLIGDGS
jgi:hypothetical protein